MDWKQTEASTLLLKKDFESFDQAWAFMTFLAKLSRSCKVQPRLANFGEQVEVEIYNDQAAIPFIDGVNNFLTYKKSESVDVLTTQNDSSCLYCDGGSRGNPGPSASGFVIFDSHNNELARGGEFLGVTTNNQAEYHSLKAGLAKAHELGIHKIKVYMDSMLVVNQISGIYKVRNRDLWPVYEHIKSESSKFREFNISHVPRELNKVADGIVNKILDDHIKD
ncbi:ribonuclease HI family protein [Candidatus Saccharibacteria bacterium]|nr:ribonuclease HI family protein [Candidatus Saccharibacteria bacterium]MCB9821263.1 ribonuclease HI family protein [Candidatus Nomurabacteria bacterium]